MRQRSDASHDRGHKVHPVAFPDNRLASVEAAVELDLFKLRQLVAFALRANGTVTNRAVSTAHFDPIVQALLPSVDLGQGIFTHYKSCIRL